MGMIYKHYKEDDFNKAIDEISTKLASMPTAGLALTKKALNKSMNNNLAAQLMLEEELQTKAGRTHDYNEGVDAFLNKRKPEFKGK